jgi:hypothetical protein
LFCFQFPFITVRDQAAECFLQEIPEKRKLAKDGTVNQEQNLIGGKYRDQPDDSSVPERIISLNTKPVEEEFFDIQSSKTGTREYDKYDDNLKRTVNTPALF